VPRQGKSTRRSPEIDNVESVVVWSSASTVTQAPTASARSQMVRALFRVGGEAPLAQQRARLGDKGLGGSGGAGGRSEVIHCCLHATVAKEIANPFGQVSRAS